MSKAEHIGSSDPKYEYYLDQFEPFKQAEILGHFARFGSEASNFILMLRKPKADLKNSQTEEPPLPNKKLESGRTS